jgi:DNA helicase-2/ATP-dependent DNA helicase PcrA
MRISSRIAVLTGGALGAMRHRGSHMQIIAAARSGKTDVLSQRIVDLLAGGVAPQGIVACTFTDRAAAELKERITGASTHRLG